MTSPLPPSTEAIAAIPAVSLREYIEMRLDAASLFEEERDRRYSEVNIEREKALKIKEEADRAALDLARQIQDYKDEKANLLREQIASERGVYATKDDVAAMAGKLEAIMKPLVEYVASQQGSQRGALDQRTLLMSIGFLILAVIGFLFGNFF